MEETKYYVISLLSASLSFIQELIPIIQLILLLISLICTLIGIYKQVREKWKKGEDISEDVKQASQVINDAVNKLKEGENNGKGRKED